MKTDRIVNKSENNKKYMLPFAAAILLLSLCLTGCEGRSFSKVEKLISDPNKPLVVSTIFPGYDFACEIAGDNANVVQLLKPGAETHTYEPTPQDMLLISECDIFIYAGGESDTWLEDILGNSENGNRITISMLDCVEALTEEEKEGMSEGGILGEYLAEEEEEYDEHTWTSPYNARLISQRIYEALCTADADNSDAYSANYRMYSDKLDALDKKFHDALDPIDNKIIVVADRFPFRYLCEEFGIDYYAAYPGCSEDAEVIAGTMISLCDEVKRDNIPIVFTIEFSNEKIADSICETTGAAKRRLHSCHNISPDDSKAGVTYIDLMNQNLDCLTEALK